MRIPLRLATASLVSASSLGAQVVWVPPGEPITRYTSGFAVSALDFFGPTGLTGRFVGNGCGGGFSGQYACAEVTVETGLEAATGVGAVRYRVTRLSSNTVGHSGLGGVSVMMESQDRWIFGTASSSALPGAVRSGLVTGVSTSDAVRRNTGIGDMNSDGTLRYETFAPMNFMLPLNFLYRDNVPTGPDCPLDRPERFCWGVSTVRVSSFTNITSVPEPSTWALLGTGLLTLGGIAVHRRKRAEN
jgi:hypothetical protein